MHESEYTLFQRIEVEYEKQIDFEKTNHSTKCTIIKLVDA
jgi:hypothetical protein